MAAAAAAAAAAGWNFVVKLYPPAMYTTPALGSIVDLESTAGQEEEWLAEIYQWPWRWSVAETNIGRGPSVGLAE